MTISSTTAQTIVLGNGVTSTFTFDFVYDSSSFISVIYTDTTGVQTLLLSSQYILNLNAPVIGQVWGVGGTVTYPTSGPAIANGTSLTISRSLPLTQTTSISNQGSFAPTVIEQALDILCMEIQQVSGRTGQLRGVWETGVSYNYGDIVQDGINGNNTQNYYFNVIPGTSNVWQTDLAAGIWALGIDVQTISGYATASAASASAAAGSASSAASSAGAASGSASAAAGYLATVAADAVTASAGAATATTQAGVATTAAGNASTSATNAATSASNASTSATNAFNSATSSATSASNASASASASAASAILAASTLTATSTTSNTIGTGSFNFTIQTNKQFQAGQFVTASSGANYIAGSVTSYNASTGALVINGTSSSGSGTLSAWNISVSGIPGANGAGTGTVTSVAVSTANGVSASVASPTTTPTLTFTLGAITPSAMASTGAISSIGTGSSSAADAATQPAIFSGGASPTAGNLVGIAVVKTGYDDALFGINKNTVTTEVPASALYISTYNETGQISIGRGNTAGLPKHADILINSSGNTSIAGNLAVAGNTAITGTAAITGTVAASNLSGTNTGDQTITLTGDVTGSGTGSFVTTIKTSVALAGSPTTTTQSPGDNTTKIATTAFVTSAVGSGGSLQPHLTVFTSSGTFTTSANITTSTVFKFTVTAGGGGGGGSSYTQGGAGGGGSGGTTVYIGSGLSPSTGYTVTIGAAGGGGAAGTSGSNGGSSSIVLGATTIASNPGQGGGGVTAGSPAAIMIGYGGSGGSTSGLTGTILIGGGGGGFGVGGNGAGITFFGGTGGASFWGQGGLSGTAGLAFGSGGGGAYYSGGPVAGSAGKSGIVIAEWQE